MTVARTVCASFIQNACDTGCSLPSGASPFEVRFLPLRVDRQNCAAIHHLLVDDHGASSAGARSQGPALRSQIELIAPRYRAASWRGRPWLVALPVNVTFVIAPHRLRLTWSGRERRCAPLRQNAGSQHTRTGAEALSKIHAGGKCALCVFFRVVFRHSPALPSLVLTDDNRVCQIGKGSAALATNGQVRVLAELCSGLCRKVQEVSRFNSRANGDVNDVIPLVLRSCCAGGKVKSHGHKCGLETDLPIRKEAASRSR